MSKRIVALLVLFLCAAPGYAKKPKATFDKSTDFARYKTYAWAKGTAAPDIVVDKIIISGTEYQLEQAGLQKADPSKADLLVRYDAVGGADVASAATDPTYATSGGIAPITQSAVWTTGGYMDTLMKGALCIRLLDTGKQQIVWTAVAEEGLDDRRARRVDQVSQIVQKMFKDFPKKK